MAFHKDLTGTDLHETKVTLLAGSPISLGTVASAAGIVVVDTTASPNKLYRANSTAPGDWQEVGASGGGTATELATTGSPVVVDTAAPPTAGQVLTATSATAATWQNQTGGANPFATFGSPFLARVFPNKDGIAGGQGSYQYVFNDGTYLYAFETYQNPGQMLKIHIANQTVQSFAMPWLGQGQNDFPTAALEFGGFFYLALGGGGANGRCLKVDTTGTVVATYDTGAATFAFFGICTDGTSIYLSDLQTNPAIHRVDLNLASPTIGPNIQPSVQIVQQIVFAGGKLWGSAPSETFPAIVELNPTTLAVDAVHNLSTYNPGASASDRPNDMRFWDGKVFAVTGNGGGTDYVIYRFDPANISTTTERFKDITGNFFSYFHYDGTNFWLRDNNDYTLSRVTFEAGEIIKHSATMFGGDGYLQFPGQFYNVPGGGQWFPLASMTATADRIYAMGAGSVYEIVKNIGAGTPPPASPAGGDLSGTYPNPTVAKVNGVTISGLPANGKALTATGPTTAEWQTPAAGEKTWVVVAEQVLGADASEMPAITGLDLDSAGQYKVIFIGGMTSGTSTFLHFNGDNVLSNYKTADSWLSVQASYDGWTLMWPASGASSMSEVLISRSASGRPIGTGAYMIDNPSGPAPEQAPMATMWLTSANVTQMQARADGGTIAAGARMIVMRLAPGGAGGPAKELDTSGPAVSIENIAPPTAGQVLTATSATAAEWQTPSGGSNPFAGTDQIVQVGYEKIAPRVVRNTNYGANTAASVATDGTYLFVMSQENSTGITRIKISDGSRLSMLPGSIYDFNDDPDLKPSLYGKILCHGGFVWAISQRNGTNLEKWDASTGQWLDRWSLYESSGPGFSGNGFLAREMTPDATGNFLLVAGGYNSGPYKLNIATGEFTTAEVTKTTVATVTPNGIAADTNSTGHVWAIDKSTTQVDKVDIATGASAASLVLPAASIEIGLGLNNPDEVLVSCADGSVQGIDTSLVALGNNYVVDGVGGKTLGGVTGNYGTVFYVAEVGGTKKLWKYNSGVWSFVTVTEDADILVGDAASFDETKLWMASDGATIAKEVDGTTGTFTGNSIDVGPYTGGQPITGMSLINGYLYIVAGTSIRAVVLRTSDYSVHLVSNTGVAGLGSSPFTGVTMLPFNGHQIFSMAGVQNALCFAGWADNSANGGSALMMLIGQGLGYGIFNEGAGLSVDGSNVGYMYIGAGQLKKFDVATLAETGSLDILSDLNAAGWNPNLPMGGFVLGGYFYLGDYNNKAWRVDTSTMTLDGSTPWATLFDPGANAIYAYGLVEHGGEAFVYGVDSTTYNNLYIARVSLSVRERVTAETRAMGGANIQANVLVSAAVGDFLYVPLNWGIATFKKSNL